MNRETDCSSTSSRCRPSRRETASLASRILPSRSHTKTGSGALEMMRSAASAGRLGCGTTGALESAMGVLKLCSPSGGVRAFGKKMHRVAQVRHTESALCFSLPVGLNSDEQGGFSFSAGDVLQLARTRLRPLRSGRFSSTSARVKMRFGLSRRGPLSVAVQGWVGGQDLYAGCPFLCAQAEEVYSCCAL